MYVRWKDWDCKEINDYIRVK